MKISTTVETKISQSARARQLESMFDVPYQETQTLNWVGEAPIEDRPWNVGLIVGPSGAGKSTVARQMFGEPHVGGKRSFTWNSDSVIDDFPATSKMNEIADVCQAVGFNTIPAWLRPYEVLSTGEKFRVDVARLLLETEQDEVMVVDEFTSVVDRQVAQVGSYAIGKAVRKADRKFVAVGCHYDVIDWLQPDWVLEPATMTFLWRSVLPRPRINVTISPVDYGAWQLFAPFHYLTAELNRAARCWCLFVNEEPAAFAGVLHRPHASSRNIKGLSRVVTLPDWQGLGLAFVLIDQVAAAYKAEGFRFRTYPAHPALIRSFDRSSKWALTGKPDYKGRKGKTSSIGDSWSQGNRPNAVFEWAGEAMNQQQSAKLFAYWGADK